MKEQYIEFLEALDREIEELIYVSDLDHEEGDCQDFYYQGVRNAKNECRELIEAKIREIRSLP